ncbi:hypothetical protein CONCODRAFT_14129 [Conidiobolus coronatus NRRL 28638]|uniref:Uncharacterized protein n=1 Tax=Conidiobolus coronatus (strain ATCC 28846 / CBS 209.66 / NRRL 28638) TaxID=796925 RepID=A0A137NPL9_CONC2|nr:hypothetical protein CONCODRAFT_14129 [Conidiobolus coronatus NRRL 28638]|eukprot:KXN64676.1 hypothetical protein CONCODRAFT_14129 [Conidiobolus coronatus NRRL 28638]
MLKLKERIKIDIEKYANTLPKDLILPITYLPTYPKDLQQRYSILVDDENWKYDTKNHQSQYEIALEMVRLINSILVEEALKDHYHLVITNDHYKYYNPDILTYPYPNEDNMCYFSITILSSKLFKVFRPYALNNFKVHSHGLRILSFNCFTSMFYAEEPGIDGPTFSVPGALFFH